MQGGHYCRTFNSVWCISKSAFKWICNALFQDSLGRTVLLCIFNNTFSAWTLQCTVSADYTMLQRILQRCKLFECILAAVQVFSSVYFLQCCKVFQCILAAVQALLQYTAGTSCTLQCRGFGRCSLGWFLNPVLAPLHLPANHFYPGTNNQHLLVFCFRC